MEKEERKFQKGCLWDIFITLLEFESLCCNTTKVVRCTLVLGKKSVSSIRLSLKPQKIPWRRSQPYSSTTCYKSNKFHLYAGDLIGICILPRLNSVVVFLQAAYFHLFAKTILHKNYNSAICKFKLLYGIIMICYMKIVLWQQYLLLNSEIEK